MKNKMLKILCVVPFCIPFAYLFLRADYYGNEWIIPIIGPLAGLLGFSFAFLNKKYPVFIGAPISMAVSLILTFSLDKNIDAGWFCPLTPMLYIILISLFFTVCHLAAFLIGRFFIKLKEKIKKK
ncbi:MAG: hypothetical protein IJ395_09400 [Clostridia bacterium]|nr:hypothetical protein [Clostridia bacterium]